MTHGVEDKCGCQRRSNFFFSSPPSCTPHQNAKKYKKTPKCKNIPKSTKMQKHTKKHQNARERTTSSATSIFMHTNSHHPKMQCIWKDITFGYCIWKNITDIKAAFKKYSTLAIQLCLCLCLNIKFRMKPLVYRTGLLIMRTSPCNVLKTINLCVEVFLVGGTQGKEV